MTAELFGEFSEGKDCKQCHRSLPDVYVGDLCPTCQEAKLFSEVKDYIRSNDVKETDVADYFNIPVSQVRKWIREGRIQYRTRSGETISSVHCQICGKAIDFGTLCPECHRLQGLKIVAQRQAEEKSLMRFLDKDKH
jgi:RNA polymerase subunit RPABC4/transcription elongation factor Spt4/ribosomal protein L32